MAESFVPNAQDEYVYDETIYYSDFLQWKGFVDRDPLLKGIISAQVDAITSSYAVKGRRADKVTEILQDMEGTGKQTFKIITNLMVKIATIGGDAYAEIVRDKVKGIKGDVPTNLIVLPPNNIGQKIKNGRLVHYVDRYNGSKIIDKADILHLCYDPFGPMTHGEGLLFSMNNLLVNKDQLMESAGKIYEQYTKPLLAYFAETDDPTELQNIANAIKDANKTEEASLVLPANLIRDFKRIGVPEGSILDPSRWERVIRDHMVMGSRTSELVLGTGSVNSEENARIQMTGFRQMVRSKQVWLEESHNSQLLRQIFPENTPSIEWSYADRPENEEFEQNMEIFKGIDAAQTLDPLQKALTLTKQLNRMGVVPSER